MKTMSEQYTPTTDTVLRVWSLKVPEAQRPRRNAEFYRWLDEVRAEALEDAANEIPGSTTDTNIDPYDLAAEWLIERADQIRGDHDE